MSFWVEIRRRKVFRVAGIYAVVAWVIAQVVSVLSTPLNLPDWFETVILVLLGIGFPIALVLAWAYELTPDGIKPAGAAGGGSSTGFLQRRGIDFAIIAALAGVVIYMVWDRAPDQARQDVPAATVAENPIIAVLPFSDLSPAGDQAHLAYGIAEEVHTQLARLEGLRLIGRTSAAAFMDAELRSIGEALGATHILGGNVRTDAGRLRITAWLSDAETGFELWNQQYNQQLSDIFAIQQSIARAVAGRLSITLGIEGQDLPGTGTSNLEAYDAYLRGRAADRAARWEEAIEHLTLAVKLDENYAAAWARLAIANGSTQWLQPPEQARETRDRAYALVRRALDMDPNLAEAHSFLAALNGARNDWFGMEEEHRKALALAPADFALRGGYAITLGRAGRLDEAVRLAEAARESDPLWVGLARFMSLYNMSLGRYAEAWAEVERAEALSGLRDLLPLYIAMGEDDADRVRQELRTAMESSAPRLAGLFAATLAAFDSPADVRIELRRYFAEGEWSSPGDRAIVASLAGYFGDPELALMAMTDELRFIRLRILTVWFPFMSEMRQLPGFKDLVTELGLVEYWRAYGWSNSCRPIGDDDFACE